MCTKIAPSFFLIVYILCINFCFISSNRSRDLRIRKKLENVWLQGHLLNDFHQKMIDTNLCWVILNIKFHKILFISSRAALFKKFLQHTQRETDRHIPETVKPCSGHPKTCKSIKKRKSKIFKKAIYYIGESKKWFFGISHYPLKNSVPLPLLLLGTQRILISTVKTKL